MFLWCLAVVELLLSKSFVLLGCPFLALWRLLEYFFCTHRCFCVAGFLALCLGYMRQIVNPRNSPLCCSSGPEVSEHSAFLPHFRILHFFTHN